MKNTNPELSVTNWNTFTGFCFGLREILKKRGAVLTAPSEKARLSFLSLPQALQSLILSNLKTFLEICEETDLETKSEWNDKVFLWNFLKHFRWKLPNGAMELISDDDVIEVLDGNGIQIFRSLKFFFITSYDIESFLCRHWYELFNRDASINEQYIAYHQKCMQTKSGTFYLMEDVPTHQVTELDSPGKIIGASKPIFCGPVSSASSTDQVEAVIHVFRPIFISSEARLKQQNQTVSFADNVLQ